MNVSVQTEQPKLFRQLEELGCLHRHDLCVTPDGFWAAKKSMANVLADCGILTVFTEEGAELECRLFFDDWYLYAVEGKETPVYSLFKMREQEFDAKMGRTADGDTPGVTVSFIELQIDLLLACLKDPSHQNRTALNYEINRVVAFGGQVHSRALKEYFVRTEVQGSYLIAKLYTEEIAALAPTGVLPVPEGYYALYQKQGKVGRLPRFIEENNAVAGRLVCDHHNIYMDDPSCPTRQERLAILATHTGNVSFYSFAAEVQFHARFLTAAAKIPIPFVGRSPYASAIRADMSIGDGEFAGPTPYYRVESKLVKNQYACHSSRAEQR